MTACGYRKNPLLREGKGQLAEALRDKGGLKNLDTLTISLGDDVSKPYQLDCTVLACRGLTDKDFGGAAFKGLDGGANDVYVTLSIKGEHEKRTDVIMEGGAEPKWGEELEGQPCRRTFSWGLNHYTKMEVWVMDKDQVSDDLLGAATIELSKKTTKQPSKTVVFEGDDDEEEGKWFQLTFKGKPAGEVQLKLQWQQLQHAPQTMKMSDPKLDLSDRSLSSQDTAFLSGWLHHCRNSITEVRIDNNPNFVGEKGGGGTRIGADERFIRKYISNPPVTAGVF